MQRLYCCTLYMYNSTTERAMATADRLNDALHFAAKKLGISHFKSHQSTAIRQFVKGHDLFVNLPTGFGKSVKFQAAPIVLDYLKLNDADEQSNGVLKTLVIVVLPLKALAVDQLKRVQDVGLQAADTLSGVTQDILENSDKYSVIFSSPETLLGQQGKELLRLTRARCRGLFIDESHCVSKWGHSSGQSSAFRKMYGQLGELRSRLQSSTAVVAFTATASKAVQQKVSQSLGLRNFGLIQESPVRPNIKYVAFKNASKDLDSAFSWLYNELKEKGRSSERTIVYCQSRKQVSDLFAMFCDELPESCHMFFNMYHTNTEDDVQKGIIDSFAHVDGDIRVLFATIAFGMGIDVRGVHTVIMVGHPTELDDLMQLGGRAGRDGQQSVAIVLDFPGAGAGLKTSEGMKDFLRGTTCRRQVVQNNFPCDKDQVPIVEHNCCDVCARRCLCTAGKCPAKLSTAERGIMDMLVHGLSTSEYEVDVVVTEDEMSQITQSLEQYRKTLLDGCDHLYSGQDLACGLSTDTIKDVVRESHINIPFHQFCERYSFSGQNIAKAVWDIVHSVVHRHGPLQELTQLASSDISTDNEEDVFEGEYAEAVLFNSDDSD